MCVFILIGFARLFVLVRCLKLSKSSYNHHYRPWNYENSHSFSVSLSLSPPFSLSFLTHRWKRAFSSSFPLHFKIFLEAHFISTRAKICSYVVCQSVRRDKLDRDNRCSTAVHNIKRISIVAIGYDLSPNLIHMFVYILLCICPVYFYLRHSDKSR